MSLEIRENSQEILAAPITGDFINLYEGRGEIDTSEGRAGTYVVGYYLSKEQAEFGVKEKGVFGQNGYVNTVDIFRQYLPNHNYKLFLIKQITIDTSIQDEQLRKAALAKLTSSEIKILGLDKND